MSALTQAKKIAMLSCLVLIVAACGSKDQAGLNTDSEDITLTKIFDAGTGTIANGSIALESYDVNGWQAVKNYTVSSEGTFEVGQPSLNNDTWYRFTLTGGQVLDLDLDGVEDDSPTEFEGRMRALVKGSTLNDTFSTHISFYTETAYTHVMNDLDADDVDWQAIESELDSVAQQLLLEDINDDNEINYQDLMSVSANDLTKTNLMNQLDARNILRAATNGISSIMNWLPNNEVRVLGSTDLTINDVVLSEDRTMLYAVNDSDGLLVKNLLTGETFEYDTGHNYNSTLAVDEANQIAYVPNARTNGVHVVDLATGEEKDSILTTMRASAITNNASGSHLYFMNSDGLHIYTVATEAISSVSMNSGSYIKLNSDETVLYIGSGDSIVFYSLADSEISFQLELDESVSGFDLSEDKSTAYVANYGGGLTIVNLEDETFETFESPDGEDVYSVFLMQDGSNQVRVISEAAFHTFDLTSNEYVDDEYSNVELDSYYAVYLPDQNIFIAGEYLSVFGAYSGPNREQLAVPFDFNVSNVVFNVDKNQVAFAQDNFKLGILNKSDGTVDYVSISGPASWITTSLDGEYYYVSIDSYGIEIIDADTHDVEAIEYTAGHNKSIIHPIDNTLYVLDWDSKDVNVFGLDDNSFVETISRNGCNTYDIDFDPTLEYLYFACNANTTGIRRFHLTDETRESFTIYSSQSLSFNSDGSLLVAGQNNQVQIFNIENKVVTETFDTNHVVYDVEFWEEKNAILASGSQGPEYIDIESEIVYEMSDISSKNFSLDKTDNRFYFAASTHGLLEIDLFDLGVD